MPWQTAVWRFDRWARDGTFDRGLSELQGVAHAAADLDWAVAVDSTIARAHRHAAAARRKVRGPGRITGVSGLNLPITRSGHSRGWTTKTHAAVDADGRPLAVRLTPGQPEDIPQLLSVLDDRHSDPRGRGQLRAVRPR